MGAYEDPKFKIWLKKYYEELSRARKVLGASPEYRIEDVITREIHILKLRDMSGSILRHATVEDYKMWLIGYLLKGGRPTHSYDYDMPLNEFYVAKKDFTLPPLYGPDHIHIIVPKNYRFLGGELGHSELYFMKDFTHMGNWVPIYRNIVFNEDDLVRFFLRILDLKHLLNLMGIEKSEEDLKKLLPRDLEDLNSLLDNFREEKRRKKKERRKYEVKLFNEIF